jgi:hypothetical protein
MPRRAVGAEGNGWKGALPNEDRLVKTPDQIRSNGEGKTGRPIRTD